jgi:short-subunit dehydrogenase
VARRRDRLDALAAELGNALVIAANLSESGAAAKLIAQCDSAGEKIDLLINNAGFGLRGAFVDLDAARQREMIDLNIGALTDLCRIVAPRMVERRSGAILNVASTAAFQPGPKMAVYFATKAYVLSFTEALFEEVGGYDVKVSALCPGPTRTEFGEVAGFGQDSRFDKIAMTAEEVVRKGLEGLEKGQAVVITGALNKAGAWGTRFLPRSTIRKIAGNLKL